MEETFFEGKIVNIVKGWLQFEYVDDAGLLQRCYIPWEVYPESKKGQARIPASEVFRGIHSGFDLINCQYLGEHFPAIRMREIQQALRTAGFWTREDYESNPERCAEVLRRLVGLDATMLSNASARLPEE